MTKLWAGRFREKTDSTVEQFTCSVSFDARLWKYDIQGSIAHVEMLGKQKIIPRKDARAIVKGLNEIASDIENGKFRFREDLEDIHMNIEHTLIKKIGPAGGRIHTARSRNDQIALDLRLYVRDEIKAVLKLLKKLRKAILTRAEKSVAIIMPGYTHLQRAQPVLLAHHLLAYYEMFDRDGKRLEDCLKRVNVMPLGSAALAGTTLPVDRKYVARLLKFPAIAENSIDAVSDRDFIIEFLSDASIIMEHLSRLSEEMILWNSEEFGFIEFPDAFATGSSIMPQKKNPDIFELVRGKTGRVYGSLMALLTIMKGLPLAYNRDMQEDKPPLFDAADTLKACLEMVVKVVPRIRFNKHKMRVAASGFSIATDIAEYLVKKGMPFREAHEVTGNIVRYCLENKKTPGEMSLQEIKKFSLLIRDDIRDYINIESSVKAKKSAGSTGIGPVLKQIKSIKARDRSDR